LFVFIHKNNQLTNGGASPTALLRLRGNIAQAKNSPIIEVKGAVSFEDFAMPNSLSTPRFTSGCGRCKWRVSRNGRLIKQGRISAAALTFDFDSAIVGWTSSWYLLWHADAEH